MKPSNDSILLMMKSTSDSIEQQIKDAVIDSKVDKINEFQTFKNQLVKLASRLDHIYQALASYLLPSLLKAHDKSGSELNSSQFLGED